jgi:hypothetical protein
MKTARAAVVVVTMRTMIKIDAPWEAVGDVAFIAGEFAGFVSTKWI